MRAVFFTRSTVKLERGQALQFAEALVEFAQRSGRIVFGSDPVELDAGGAHARLAVGDPVDHDLVAAALQRPRQRGHGIDVPRSGEAERS